MMMCAFKNFGILGAMAVAGGLAAGAQAATLSATFHGASPSLTIQLSLDGGHDYDDYVAGLMNWTKTGGDYDGVDGDYSTFCIELTEHVHSGDSYTFDVVDTQLAPTSSNMGIGKADLIDELYGRFFGDLNFDDPGEMAAFQLAVWEIVYDSGVDLTDGWFRAASGSHRSLAQSYLNALDGSGPRLAVEALAQVGVQDQLVVPEPASALLLSLSLAAWRRR